jgi:hypothetical protein
MLISDLLRTPEGHPDRVPVDATRRQGPSCDTVVNLKAMQRFEETTVIAALVASPGARGGNHPLNHWPIFYHSHQHDRAS